MQPAPGAQEPTDEHELTAEEEDRLFQQRLDKLNRLRAAGVDPYPARFERTDLAADVVAGFDESPGTSVRVAGRVVGGIRRMGKATFFHLLDRSGRIQVYVKRDVVGDEQYGLLELVDAGDFLGVEGETMRTRTGEVTVQAQMLVMLSKSLRPLPEKWHGLQDVETRYRKRYLDLIANPEVMEVFRLRSRIVHEVRAFLVERGFLEVETPILQSVPGGGSARPFGTYYNALDRTLSLRIALELYLKRCIIGGIEKVFEIGRNFRNEGLSLKHNPEFTMLEVYQAYADYQEIMRLTEDLVAAVATRVLGTPKIVTKGQHIDLSPPWPRIPLRRAIYEASGVDYDAYPDAQSLAKAAAEAGLRVQPGWSRGKLIDELLSVFVEPRVTSPVFLVDYPLELSPLAKRSPGNPDVVERFEAFCGGMEIANAFSELNDPVDQRERFLAQARLKGAGDDEAMPFDAGFLEALEHGMPPTGGMGMGIDRLAMVLTGQDKIRDVILFPQLRTLD
ncbi:MAG: lysine--tRNA ligase [Chloroflexi bacterium]|nr:lysine--tRNA ligase [Chloroflexota bacterium]